MPPLLQSVTYLRPPKGPALVLTENETWLGRNSFELSEKGQALCSRRQACLKITNAAVMLECHGLNPICFVICRSVKFQAKEDAPPSRLYQLKKGEVVELAAGDKFFLVPKECLLTVGIESDCDGAADAGPLNDDRSLAHQVCSPKATQLGQGLNNSPAEQYRLLQTGEPARLSSADVLIHLANGCFTGEISDRNLTVSNSVDCPPNESYECNILRNSPAPPSGLQVPLVEGRSVFQTDFYNTAAIGDLTPGEVVIDATTSIALCKTTIISDGRHGPEPFGSDSFGAGDRLDRTQGATMAACSSMEGSGYGCNNDSKARVTVKGIHPDTMNCGLDSKFPGEIEVNGRSDDQEASQQIATAKVSGCSSPPFAFPGGTASGEIESARTSAVVSGGPDPEIWRPDLSAAGEASLNATQGCIVADGSSVERRVCSSGNVPTGENAVTNIHPDTMNCRLDLLVNTNPGAHEAGKQKITRNVSGCTSSALCVESNRIRDDMPSASISRLDRQQNPPLRSGLPAITEFPEQAAASTSGTMTGKYRAVEISEISTPRVNLPPQPGPSSRSPPLIGTSSTLPMAICEPYHVHEPRELPPKQLELVDLTTSEDEGNSQAQIQSQSAQVEQSMCNNSGTGPLEGMEKVIVTVSGYEDLLRARLINLISATGASYTGSLTKMNTHVVCWKFRGAKYDMAKKLGQHIINHRWFEDCLTAGKRLPEGPYKASGEMSKPLLWDQSSVQHPSSTVGFDSHRDCNSPLSREQYMGQERAALVIGEPSRSLIHGDKIAGHSGQSASSLRGESSTLDRGKRLVDLNGPASHLQGYKHGNSQPGFEDVCEIRTLSETGNAIDFSTPHHAQQQESDDFWNEVIRAYDERKAQATELSCQVLSMANHRTGLKEPITRTTRRAASPIPGSSLRELDPEVHDEIRSKRRNAIANEAGSSRLIQGEIIQPAIQSHSFVGEQSDNLQRDVFQRKRKQTSVNVKGKYRRLVRKSAVPAAADDLPSQVLSTVGITSGVQPTLNSVAPQRRASTVDAENDSQQRAGVIEIDSDSGSGEKAGECPSSDEIACVICHSETKPTIEGVLACGHQFCYPCIQRWADEAKSPTCPLCKVAFDFITFREMAKAGEDGSCAVLEERIVQIGQQTLQENRPIQLPTLRTETVCVACGSRDTPELLLICTNCGGRACHTFCLDPPRPPGSCWYCNRCFQVQSRVHTREAYGRLFQRSSPQRSTLREQHIPDVATNLALQSTPTSRIGASGVGQSSSSAPRRGRQCSLHNFLVRQNDV